MITAQITINELDNGVVIFEFLPSKDDKMTEREARIGNLVAFAMDKIMEAISAESTVIQSVVTSGADDDLCDALIEQARRMPPL